jgi:DNA-binding transcriptional MerR regulator
MSATPRPRRPRNHGSKGPRAGKSKAVSGSEEAGFDLGTDKLYFKIGEVAEIVDVAAHVLRYWESEFTIIKPQKSRSQQRVYRRKDVENLLRIKHLLYDRKFTIAGARQELRKGAGKVEPAPVSGIYRAKQSLARVREQLDLLAAAVRADPEPAHLASDPAAFMRSVGGARGVLDAEAGAPSILDRPERGTT